MKVILLSPLPPPSGGIATWTLQYKKCCEGNNIQLKIINIAMLGNRAASETTRKNYVLEFKRTIGIVSCLKKAIKHDKPEIIHINTSCSKMGVIRDAICMFFSYKVAPTIVHCHCNIEDQLKGRLSKKAFAYLIKKSSGVIVLNNHSKRYVDNKSIKKAVIVPNFLPYERIREPFVVNDVITNVITVGHIEESKGLLEIVEVAKLLPSIRFTLVGAVRSNISNLSIPNNLVFTGRVEPEIVFEKLDSADVFLLPTKSEGFSLAILEAMARGLPIITTMVGANAEMIEEGGGVLLEEGGSQDIVNALLKINSAAIRQKISNWNIEKVRNCYSDKTVMKQYNDIYNKVIKGLEI